MLPSVFGSVIFYRGKGVLQVVGRTRGDVVVAVKTVVTVRSPGPVPEFGPTKSLEAL